MATFGTIDILVNNASAISLTETIKYILYSYLSVYFKSYSLFDCIKGSMNTTMKSYDLLTGVNGRATFMISKICLPHLIASAKNGRNPHILNNAPVSSFDLKSE